MIWKLALAAILVFNLATWSASLIKEDESPPAPTQNEDQGYSIDPNG